MTLPLRAAALFIAGSALLTQAHAAPASVCDLVKRDTVTSFFGRITETDVKPTACTFMTDFDGGTGIFYVMRYDVPVPESQYADLTMRTSPADKIVDVPGIGDKAIINMKTNDMVLRARGKVYSLSTRGMPCGSKKYGIPANRDEEAACELKRIEALKILGAQIAR